MPWVIAKKNGRKWVPGFLLTKAEVERLDDDPENTYMIINTGTHQQLTIGKGKGRKKGDISYERGMEERGAPANADNVRELVLFIDNDGDLYRQMTTPIMKNLAKKMLKGTYNHALAVKGWGHLANAGAQKYTKEYGGSGNGSYGSFSPADRKAAAAELADAFEREMEAQGQAGIEHLAKGR